MSGSLGFNKSKNQSNSSFSQSVGNQGAMDNLYSSLGSLWGNTGGQSGQQQSQFGQQFSQDAMQGQIPAWKQQMQGGAYAGLGVGNKLMDSLEQSQNTPSNMQFINESIMGGKGNNYADAMKDEYIQDASRAQDSMLQGLDARAAAAGMSGGARAGIAQGKGMEGINRNLQSAMATTGFNSFDKDLDRKLNIAGQADQNNFGRQQMMQQMLGSQQSAMQGGMQYGQSLNQQGQQQQNMPWQQAGQYANAIGGPTILGEGTSSASGGSTGLGLSGSGGNGGGKG